MTGALHLEQTCSLSPHTIDFDKNEDKVLPLLRK
jgi:hypothetical protein